jgi:hypothetical protein
VAEYHDPVDSGDPRLENAEFRQSLEKMTLQQRLKEEGEVAQRMKEQQDQTEVTQALLSLAQDFETKVQADIESEQARPLDHTVTSEVRQTATDFSTAWNELITLESAVLDFSGVNYSLEALKPYLTSAGSAYRPNLTPFRFSPTYSSRVRVFGRQRERRF